MSRPRRMLLQVADRVLLRELRRLSPSRVSVAAYRRTLRRLTRKDLTFIRAHPWMRQDADDVLIWFGHDDGPRREFGGLLSIIRDLGGERPAQEFVPLAPPKINPMDAVALYRTLYPPETVAWERISFRPWS